MSAEIEEIVRALLRAVDREIDAMVERKIEHKLPQIVRALGLTEVPAACAEESAYVDAIEIAKILGRDTSTPKAVRAARKHVYNLANLKRIPCVRPTPRRMVFDPVAVRKALKDSQQESHAA